MSCSIDNPHLSRRFWVFMEKEPYSCPMNAFVGASDSVSRLKELLSKHESSHFVIFDREKGQQCIFDTTTLLKMAEASDANIDAWLDQFKKISLCDHPHLFESNIKRMLDNRFFVFAATGVPDEGMCSLYATTQSVAQSKKLYRDAVKQGLKHVFAVDTHQYDASKPEPFLLLKNVSAHLKSLRLG